MATELHTACSAKDWQKARALLAANPALARVQDDRGCLPLHVAANSLSVVANSPQADMIKELLKAYPEGKDVKDSDGETFEDICLEQGFFEAMKEEAKENA
jgi:ankyrin repeat protein